MYFDMATGLQGEQALAAWRCCLEAGDSMAHFALGYTLYELERYREAYAHLRLYTELAPHAAWNWCWFGKAALAIGETQEARSALKRAVELTAQGDHETDAPELLAALRGT
jgi:tetratricopeptide (TPR) repeat protein